MQKRSSSVNLVNKITPMKSQVTGSYSFDLKAIII